MKCVLLLLMSVRAVADLTQLVISEFLADNEAVLQSSDGKYPDWIEIWNPSANTVNLSGLYLTDDEDDKTQFQFPADTSMAPDSYLVVYATDDEGLERLSTGFKLGKGGEYLGLIAADGTTVIYEYAPEFPEQSEDVSFGVDENGDIGYFSTPTPGAANPTRDPLEPVADVVVSVERGFKDAPFDVELSTTTESAEIRYTTDGSVPTIDGNGEVYSGPITVSTTTNLRAVGFRGNFQPSKVATTSYIFLNDVLNQPAEVPNFPVDLVRTFEDSGKPVTLDMEMDPEVVAEYSDEIETAMKDIPTMVIAIDPTEIWDDEDSFYIGDEEKEVSVEMIYPDGMTDQVNTGIENHAAKRIKTSMRLNFRNDYGTRVWETDLFKKYAIVPDETATTSIRKVVLRAGNTESWARTRSNSNLITYITDEWARRTQMAMSGYGSRGVFVHLYLNNVYWGMYNVVERPDDSWAQEYFGGDEDDWEWRNHGNPLADGTENWAELLDSAIAKDLSDSANYEEVQKYIDVQDFCDYCILQWYMGNDDWPHNNWYAVSRLAESEEGPEPFHFVVWDAEEGFLRPARMRATFRRNGVQWENKNPAKLPEITRIMHALRDNASFRNLLAERADYLVENTLSESQSLERYNTLVDYIRTPIIAESARWGDTLLEQGIRRQTRDQWQENVEYVRDKLIPGNGKNLLALMSRVGMYGRRMSASYPCDCKVAFFMDGTWDTLNLGIGCFEFCNPFLSFDDCDACEVYFMDSIRNFIANTIGITIPYFELW